MKINRELWLKLQQPFDQLIGLEGEQREQTLQQLDLNAEDRQVLRSLLEASDQSADMNLTAPQRLNLNAPLTEVDWIGCRLGPWKVVRRLAQGGMGVVYLGERADGEFEKQVAIKVLDVVLQGSSQRLREEIRILARLEHPLIARLMDSGSTGDGHAWLVMELIEGQVATDFFAQRPASIRARIETMIRIADALDYAHQRRVIHCDIKPDNVLIREDGRPCLVDFGISSLVERPGESEPIRRQKYYSRHYTAPERLAGAPPETAQDIYSLGALMQRLLRDQAADIPMDVKAIIQRAMADEPSDRYASMTEFKSDLSAWLQRKPVRARDAGHGYVLARWLQRNALTASLFGLLIISLLAGLGISLQQTNLARAEAERANAVKRVLVDIFTSADPAQEDGDDPPASELLRRGATRVPLDLAGQPEIQVELLQIIGYSQLERGQHVEAAATMDFALSLFERLPPQVGYPNVLSDRAMVHYEQGELSTSVAVLERAQEQIRQIDANHSDRALIETRLADMYLVNRQFEQALSLSEQVLAYQYLPITTEIYAARVKGGALEMLGRYGQADQALQTALDLQLAHDPDDAFAATIMNDMAILRYSENRMQEAVLLFEQVIEQQSRVYGQTHPRTLTSIGNLASVEMAMGEYEDASRRFSQSLNAHRALYGDTAHPSTIHNQGYRALSRYFNGQLQSAYPDAEQARNDYLALAEENRVGLAWVEPLLGLLALQLKRDEYIDLINTFDGDCASMNQNSQLTVRFCLAKSVYSLLSASECEQYSSIPPLSETALERLDQDWQQVLNWMQASCNAASSINSDSLPLPDWLAHSQQGL